MHDNQIRRALLDAYRRLGRVRIPLPALVCFAMRELGTSDATYLSDFRQIHSYIRSQWGNDGLFSRRKGVKGGIKIRDKIKI